MLRKFGDSLEATGTLAAEIKEALQSEASKSDKEHNEFQVANLSVIECAEIIFKQLSEVSTTIGTLITALKDFSKVAEQNHQERDIRISSLIGGADDYQEPEKKEAA